MGIITVTSAAQQINEPGRPLLLANMDTAAVIYLDTSRSVSAYSTQLPPLGTLAVDGQRPWYAATVAGQEAVLQVIPGGTQWSPSPSQIAEQIALTGINVTVTGLSTIAPSGDTTGATDTTTIQAALNNTSGNEVLLAGGTYHVNATLTIPPGMTVSGSGMATTVINFTGTGDCLRITSPTLTVGGKLADLTIDGSSAGAGSAGIHMGDISSYRFDDVQVRNFSAAGSIGFHFDNQYNWTEKLHGVIFAANCSSHVVFDVTTSTSTSFMRMRLGIYIAQGDPAQDGVVFRGGAGANYSEIYIGGNFLASSAALTSAVLRMTGQLAGAYSGISYSHLKIGVECNGSVGAGPITIAQGAAQNGIVHCSGGMNFASAPQPFTSAPTDPLSYFAGFVSGDVALGSGGYYGDSFTSTNLISAGFKIATPEINFTATGGGHMFQGSGAPNRPNGQNPVAGDIYFRTDTPTTGGQRIYVCTVGGPAPTWLGII